MIPWTWPLAGPDSRCQSLPPGFSVKSVDIDEIYAAFLNESRTRGPCLVPRTGNSGRDMRESVSGLNPGMPRRQRSYMPDNATASPLTLDVVRAGNAFVVHCNGKLVAGVHDVLYVKVCKLIPDTKRIVLDLTNLTRVDSMGLGTLVRLYLSVAVGQVQFRTHQSRQTGSAALLGTTWSHEGIRGPSVKTISRCADRDFDAADCNHRFNTVTAITDRFSRRLQNKHRSLPEWQTTIWRRVTPVSTRTSQGAACIASHSVPARR